MAHRIHFYPIDGGKPLSFYGNRPYDLMVESFAYDAMPLGWVKDEDAPYDREFEDQCDRYGSHDLYNGDDSITVVTFDGKVIGTLDDPVPADFSKYTMEDA